jgi:hypothetical protein
MKPILSIYSIYDESKNIIEFFGAPEHGVII